MTRNGILVAAISAALATAGMTAARAHSPQACVKQIKTYKQMCKLSPTALIFGLCVVKQTIKDCTDRKVHDAKFHK